MTLLRIQTPSRLHFGPLAWGPATPRKFGGVGLMIARPGIDLTAEPSEDWDAHGPLAERVLTFARRAVDRLETRGTRIRPLFLRVREAAPEHVGLGTGTQMGLAVARLIVESASLSTIDADMLADLSGRGLRSGIGLHGFLKGGLIVDGGHGERGGLPPLVARAEFPAAWRILIVRPDETGGLHGDDESRAFERLPDFSERLTDRLCRLILIGLLPAVIERDLEAFGAALSEIQDHVGLFFSSAQGGTYARPWSERLTAFLRELGLQGVGQSSWGPILYGFTDQDETFQSECLARLRERFDLPPHSTFWTVADPCGARLSAIDGSPVVA